LRLSSLERLAKAYGIQVHELLGPEMPKTHFPEFIVSKRADRAVNRSKTRISAKTEISPLRKSAATKKQYKIR
jgi:hypothetical protein